MNFIKYSFILLILSSTALLSACTTPPANQLYAQGQAAYHSEDFHTAFVRLLAAAEANSVQAQYAVGYMYYYGIGTETNTTQAMIWLKKSAATGNIKATQALESIEKGVPKPL